MRWSRSVVITPSPIERSVVRNRIDRTDRLGSFVLTTCRYLVWDENRAEQRRWRDLGEMSPRAIQPPAVTEVERRALEGCVARLDPREREVVLSTYVEDLDAAQIGDRLGLTPGHVRVIRHRALTRLAACLAGDAEEVR